eukprot:285104-Amorphochlora_amoeboformis.AAC.1
MKQYRNPFELLVSRNDNLECGLGSLAESGHVGANLDENIFGLGRLELEHVVRFFSLFESPGGLEDEDSQPLASVTVYFRI